MRRLLFATIATLAISFGASAQGVSAQQGAEYRPHEVSLSYGYITQQFLVNNFIHRVTLGQGDIEPMLFGAVSGEYLYFVNKHIGVGGTLSYEYGREAPNKENLKARFHYCTVMPTAKFYWFNRPYVGMYTNISAGATFGLGTKNGEFETRILPAFHLGAVGLEAGGQLRGFLEVGFGVKGFIQAGIRYKF